MKTSTNRILTTHVGSLPRPVDLREMMRARQNGQPYDQRALAARVRSAVAEVVRQQVECGVDIPSDGEMGKISFLNYANERHTGFEPQELQPGESPRPQRRDWQAFAEFYEEYWQTQGGGGHVRQTSCTSPITYRGQAAVQADIENFKTALTGLKHEEAFIPAIAPGTFGRGQNQYYPNEQAFFYAIAEALKEEYRAIVDAGIILQIDDPGLPDTWDMLMPAPTIGQYRKFAALRVEALNHALAGIPEEKVRYHLCWGSWHGPHTTDIPLKDVVDLLLQVRAAADSVEAANPRHAHEWHVWEEVKLPDGKVLIPGVIAHSTPIVEHPELVADRIATYAKLVGRENVIAGTDCGFSQGALNPRLHPTVVWAKLRALSEGAAIATKRLW